MRRLIIFSFSLIFVLSLCGCSGGRSAMAGNEKLGEILSKTAGSATVEATEPTPEVDKLSDKSSSNEGKTYYKLKSHMNTFVDAGTYAVSMAEADCSVTAYDASGKAIGSITISKDKSDSPLPHVGNLTVPESGYLVSTADCVAMKTDK